MILFIMLWAAIFTVLGIIVGTQNGTTLVDISLLTWTFHSIPLTLVLIETFAIGIVFTIIVAVIDEVKLKNRLWKANRENRELKKELTSLRNLPVEEIIEKTKEDEQLDEKSEEQQDVGSK